MYTPAALQAGEGNEDGRLSRFPLWLKVKKTTLEREVLCAVNYVLGAYHSNICIMISTEIYFD